MALIPFPAVGFDAKWRLTEPAQVNVSEWSGGRKVIGGPGPGRWSCQLTFEPLITEDEERTVRAFLLALRGQVNVTDVVRNCQISSGSPLVGPGAGNSATMPVKNMPPNVTYKRAGDFLSVPLPSGHVRLIGLTADLVSNGLGNGLATFRPALHQVPGEGVFIYHDYPICRMALATPDHEIDYADGIASVALSFVEAL